MQTQNNISQPPVTEEMRIYSNPQFGEIRVLRKEGKVLFVGTDITAALGYVNLSAPLLDYINSEEISSITLMTSGVQQTLILITITGVYQLLNRSPRPNVRELRDWITDEVLPLIYRQEEARVGSLSVYQEKEEVGKLVEKELEAREACIRGLLEENAEQKRQLVEYEPKAWYYDTVLQSKELMTTTQIAKDYGMTAQELNWLLHEKGIQYRQGHVWLLYREYVGKGYAQSRTTLLDGEYVCCHTCWTQKGRVFIYQVLKENGILPLSERNEAHSKSVWI